MFHKRFRLDCMSLLSNLYVINSNRGLIIIGWSFEILPMLPLKFLRILIVSYANFCVTKGGNAVVPFLYLNPFDLCGNFVEQWCYWYFNYLWVLVVFYSWMRRCFHMSWSYLIEWKWDFNFFFVSCWRIETKMQEKIYLTRNKNKQKLWRPFFFKILQKIKNVWSKANTLIFLPCFVCKFFQSFFFFCFQL